MSDIYFSKSERSERSSARELPGTARISSVGTPPFWPTPTSPVHHRPSSHPSERRPPGRQRRQQIVPIGTPPSCCPAPPPSSQATPRPTSSPALLSIGGTRACFPSPLRAFLFLFISFLRVRPIQTEVFTCVPLKKMASASVPLKSLSLPECHRRTLSCPTHPSVAILLGLSRLIAPTCGPG